MFRGLRLRLTLLYILAALALITLVGGGTYWLIDYYFQTTTDLGLQHKMAHEFRLLGAPVPPELAAADLDWYANRAFLLPSPKPSPSSDRHNLSGEREQDHDHTEEYRNTLGSEFVEAYYDSELAGIFVLPLNADGQLLFDPNPYTPPFEPDLEAVAAANTHGTDWRTVQLDNNTRVRLLTYRLTRSDGPALLQLGRTLADQDRVLNQLLLGLLGLGGISAVLLGAGSWWLAGRALGPAQQAWSQQQAFIANASHELRTPLTLLRASTEVALRGLPAADTDRRELLGDVLQECDHMTHLVEDLLLLSRLDAGRLKLEREVISLPNLLEDVQRQVGRLARERGVHISINAAQGVVRGDSTRLRQVLLILLDNALRYTPHGGSICLEARPQGRQVQIAVIDTGSGIAPEHVPHVFERFYRPDSARSSASGGSGLGLSIARALIQAQQGQISIDSRLGEGTRVTLALPAAEATVR